MAIRLRRGNLADFDKNKLVAGELGLILDAGELHFCYSAGNTKKLQTAEDLQSMLDASGTAYSALQQLIADLELNPSELTNILNNITALQTNKADKLVVDGHTAWLGEIDSELIQHTSQLADIAEQLAENEIELEGRGISIKLFGAIGDGLTHPLSADFPTLALAQIKFPFATDLSNEIDGLATQKCINYCAGTANGQNTVFIPDGNYKISLPLEITDVVSFDSGNRAWFNNVGVQHNCFNFTTALNFMGYRMKLPNLVGFDIGMRILGCSLADIFCNYITGCKTAIQIETSASHDHTLDNNVTGHTIVSCDVAVRIKCSASNEVIQGNKIEYNFVNDINTGIFFDGSNLSPAVNNNVFRMLALEGGGIIAGRKGVLSNYSALAQNKFYFDGFLGGFLGAEIDIPSSNGNYFILSLIGTHNNGIKIKGIGNYIQSNAYVQGGITSPVTAIATPNNLVGFNGGFEMLTNHNVFAFATPASYVAGDNFSMYLWNGLLDGYSHNIDLSFISKSYNIDIVTIQDCTTIGPIGGGSPVPHQLQILFKCRENVPQGAAFYLRSKIGI